MKEGRFEKKDRVVVKATGKVSVVKGDYGPKFHPPYLLDNGRMYSDGELALASDYFRDAETAEEGGLI